MMDTFFKYPFFYYSGDNTSDNAIKSRIKKIYY